MPSCKHVWEEQGIDTSTIHGNNFDIKTTWCLFKCTKCAETEKEIVNSERIERV